MGWLRQLLDFMVPEERLELSSPRGAGDFESANFWYNAKDFRQLTNKCVMSMGALALLFSDPAHAAQPAAYLTYVLHTESRLDSPVMYASPEAWAQTRHNIVAWARLVEAEGQALDLFFSPDYMEAEREWGRDYAQETGGTNLFLWLDRLPHVEVGAHVDEADGQWLYADAQEILLGFGVRDHGIVGGTFCIPGPAGYTEFWSGQTSSSGWTWRPTIIHGLASPGHVCDLRDSGVWRPSLDSAWMNDPSGPLVAVGGHRNTTETIMGELGACDPARLNTFSVQIFQAALSEPDFLAGRRREAGMWAGRQEVAWATLTEVAAVWRAQYLEEPSLVVRGAW